MTMIWSPVNYASRSFQVDCSQRACGEIRGYGAEQITTVLGKRGAE